MNHTEAINAIMNAERVTQKDIAMDIGAKSQSVISERINYKTIGIKPFLEMLDVMGYEIVVRKANGPYQEGEYPIRLSDYQRGAKKKATLNEVIEKYRHADIATFVEDPSGPIEALIEATGNLRIKDFVGWDEFGITRGNYLKRDTWFNQPVNFAVTRNEHCPSISVTFYFNDEMELCLNLSKKLCESMFSKYGSAEAMGRCIDTSAISRTYADVTERELRENCIDSGDYQCDWGTREHRIRLTHAHIPIGLSSFWERTISVGVSRKP